MSFTSQVKGEICQNNELANCCKKAELSAFLQMNASLNLSSEGMYLKSTSENASTAKRIYQLVNELYHVETELSVIRKMNLKKNNIYVIKIKQKALDILKDLGIYNNGLQSYPNTEYSNECCLRAYLAGAFLAKGSVNSPNKSNYHLEIACSDEEFANYLQTKMNEHFALHAKIIKRRSSYVVYLKAGDKISDFLKLVGTTNALFEFEDARIQRDFVNNLTRLDNCELANELKSMKTGAKQLEDIERIENFIGLEALPDNLQEVARIRKANPEASLNELCEIYQNIYQKTISKSGIRHRLNKIKELAQPYKQR